MAYRAEIEIGVRGQRELERLRSLITQSTQAFESLNRVAAARGGLNQTLSNYSTQLTRAKRAIDNVTMGTEAEVKAIREYVSAMGAANAARSRQNYLIAQEIANRRRVQVAVNAGFGQQGPALPPSMRNAGFGQQGPALPPRAGAGRTTAGGGGGRLGGAVSGAIIGGAFPLLFGQGGGAATGGAVGGLVGGLAGPGGSFAGSLLGTLIGDIAEKGSRIKELAADIGFSAEQTQQLQQAFKLAGQDADKFTEAVQNIRGVGLAIEDQAKAIQLVSTLTEQYGGNITKTSNALTSALESGKVTQATLNQLTSQGINIQDALAAKYKTSRENILVMAKDGKISVQDLIDTLVVLGNAGTKSSDTLKTKLTAATDTILNEFKRVTPEVQAAFSQIEQAAKGAFGEILTTITPVIVALIQTSTEALKVAAAFASFGTIPSYIQNVTKAVLNLIPGINIIYNTLQLIRSAQGKKPERQGPAVPARLQRRPLESFAAPAQAIPSAGGARAKRDKAADDAQRLAALLGQLREQIRIEKKSLELQDAIAFARADGNEKLVAFLQTQEKYYDLDQKQAKLQRDLNADRIKDAEYILRIQLLGLERKKIELLEEQRLNDLFRERVGLTNAVIDASRKAREAAFGQGLGGAGTFRTDMNLMPELTGGAVGTRISELQTELTELVKVQNQVIFAAQAIGDAFGTSLKGVIDGTMTAQQALANFFQSVADYFADMASQMIAKWLQMQILGLAQSLLPGGSSIFPQGVGDFSGAFGGGGGLGSSQFGGGGMSLLRFANGGMPPVGRPSIVGERGPELFVPRSSGTIIPNDQLGGTTNVVVNVDAKGSNVQGDDSQAKALGSAISVAVQAEIVKQQRPGGLLAGTR